MALGAVLYGYWLNAPVLSVLSVREWRAMALAAAAIIGTMSALIRFDFRAAACSALAGQVIGGTWVVWKFPNDVRVSLVGAFEVHLEWFWRDLVLRTAIVAVSGHCTEYLIRLNSRNRQSDWGSELR